METRFQSKCEELGDVSYQIVFHGTDERSNVDSILQSGFDKKRVKRVRRGFSPAWTSSSFDKVLGEISRSENVITTFTPGLFLCPQAGRHPDEQVAAGSVLGGQLQGGRGSPPRHQALLGRLHVPLGSLRPPLTPLPSAGSKTRGPGMPCLCNVSISILNHHL